MTAQGKESRLALGWLRDSARPPNETQFVAALRKAGVTPDLVINCLELARDPADSTDHLGFADEVFLRINESIGREIWASVPNMLNEKRDVDRTIHIYCKSGRHRSLAEFYCRVSPVGFFSACNVAPSLCLLLAVLYHLLPLARRSIPMSVPLYLVSGGSVAVSLAVEAALSMNGYDTELVHLCDWWWPLVACQRRARRSRQVCRECYPEASTIAAAATSSNCSSNSKQQATSNITNNTRAAKARSGTVLPFYLHFYRSTVLPFYRTLLPFYRSTVLP